MITVTTPNGRVGSIVLRHLLDQGETVRVISYRPDCLPANVRDRCEVIAGSIGDTETMRRGLENADQLFWCIPQARRENPWSDAIAYHQRFTDAAASALEGSDVRVVTISTGRRGYEDGAILSAFTAMEHAIDQTGVPVRHLRAAFLMENLMGSLPTIARPGAVFLNGPGDLPLPMVCVADLAAKAVTVLTDPTWRGQGSVAVHGPAHVSFDEMAVILTHTLDRPVCYIAVPDAVLIDNLRQAGFPDGYAQAFAKLLTADALRAYDLEPRTPETTTPTTLAEWSATELRPSLERLA